MVRVTLQLYEDPSCHHLPNPLCPLKWPIQDKCTTRVLLEQGLWRYFMLGQFLYSQDLLNDTCINEVDKRCSTLSSNLFGPRASVANLTLLISISIFLCVLLLVVYLYSIILEIINQPSSTQLFDDNSTLCKMVGNWIDKKKLGWRSKKHKGPDEFSKQICITDTSKYRRA